MKRILPQLNCFQIWGTAVEKPFSKCFSQLFLITFNLFFLPLATWSTCNNLKSRLKLLLLLVVSYKLQVSTVSSIFYSVYLAYKVAETHHILSLSPPKCIKSAGVSSRICKF